MEPYQIFLILIVTIIIGLIIRFQNRVYEAEQQKIVEQNRELELLSRTTNKKIKSSRLERKKQNNQNFQMT